MAWLGAIGATVLAAFGATGAWAAAAGLAAMVVGGAIVGAAVGALYSAFTGGNILEGALYGAIGGAVLGGGAYALGFGASPASSGMTTIAPGATLEVAGQSITFSGTQAAAEATTAATIWSAEGLAAMGGLATLGSNFLAGGTAGADRDAELAFRREELAAKERMAREANETALKQAQGGSGAQMAQIEAQERIANERLAFEKDKFKKEFEELKFQDRDTRAQEEKKRREQQEGILAASQYVGGNVQTVTLAESIRQRANMPEPVWKGQQQQPEAA